MLNTLFLVLALPLPQGPGADTTQTFAGVLNQQYAWGVVGLQDGQVLRGFLPANANGSTDVIPYYQLRSDGSRPRKPRALTTAQVQWMRVRGQYSELLGKTKDDTGELAARRTTGALELFVVKSRPPFIVNFMGPTPVAGLPTASAAPVFQGPVSWYLRHPGAAAVRVESGRFASQVPAFLRKDAELARRVSAGDEGYRFADLESIVQQYNERVK
ncbi:hypothetical protein QMK33_10905 [Hymenobacter sp. H14-R3]|uniref:hypothetical protein n=1 Tax=Hymenobacter sp. H14-R3 TaxID=3046308 RepID=UPI0024B9E9E3|nr:hypothetical protein [Hymenobacter sp. H14-R3]MDJ0365662.1 hypothetical protein [Hymenobacter sp. H14-R3]